MTISPEESTNEITFNELSNAEFTNFTSAPYIKQLGLMLKISFLQRIRSPTLYFEIGLPLIFLIFECIFASRINPYSDSLLHPQIDQAIPFSSILGSTPNYGMIPKNDETSYFIDILNEKSYLPNKQDVIYFESFHEYQKYIMSQKEVNDNFYCSEWNHSSDYNTNSIRLSSNGKTIGSLPFLVQNIGETIIHLTKPTTTNSTTIFLNYKKFPHQKLFKSDHDNALYVAIFATAQSVVCISTTGTFFGSEAESGLRDLFTFFGLSFFVNEMRWYILSVVICFIISFPFAIATAILIKINFALLLILYLLSSTSFSSFLLFLMSLYPRMQMGNIVAYIFLLTLFICIFWGYFDFLFKESGYIEKYIFSIFPQVAVSYTLAQMASGEVTKVNQINGPSCYPVKNGFLYLAVETFVYFVLYICVEYLKPRLWLPSPMNWGKSLNEILQIENNEQNETIIVENVVKKFKETVALNDVSFKVNKGETLAIVGPNGAGKSTLISLLSGTMKLDEGLILFNGINVMENTKAIHQIIGLCPQKNLFMNELTADEWIKTVCTLRNNQNFDYNEIFMSLGLDEQRKCRIGKMSGGNKRKICLAASLVCNPPIVILDEATSGVDFTSRTRIWSIVSGLTKSTVIMATHTLEECEKIADKIIVIVDGKIIYFDTPNVLRQIFKCGYLIITDDENYSELERIINENGLNSSIIVEDSKIKLPISSDESDILPQILEKIRFKYILTIQSLEETIFKHIKDHESNLANNSDSNKMECFIDESESLYMCYPEV